MSTTPQPLLVGIDGGASKTRLCLETPAGVRLAEARAGPANIGRDPAQAAASIAAALDEALHAAGLSGTAVRLRVGAGLAGALVDGAVAAFRACWTDARIAALEVRSDAHTACVGAHGGRDGAVLAIGTGSVGYALVGGVGHRAGGWGFPAGDEGGGAWLGLHAVGAALRARDAPAGPGHEDNLAALVERLAASRPGGLPGWAARAGAAEFAALAPHVFEAAGRGEADAVALLERGAAEIVALAGRLPPGLPCCLLGGLAEPWRPWLPAELRARLVPPAGDAVDGALHLAGLTG